MSDFLSIEFYIFLGALILLSTIRRKVNPSGQAASTVKAFLSALLVIIAGYAFFRTALGGFTLGLVTGGLGFVNAPLALAAKLAALIALIIIYADVKDRQVDGPATTALFLLPGLVLLFGGPLSSLISTTYGAAYGAGLAALNAI